MKVFVSWSGDLSREVAEMLRRYLPCMLQDLDVFVSRHDVESGSRWNAELSSRLNESLFGIFCLTPDNHTAPWMVYEAGALTHVSDGRACGLLLAGLTPANVSGPMAQFQHRKMDEEDFRFLLRDINLRMENPLQDELLQLVFSKWWPDLRTAYTNVLRSTPANASSSIRRTDRDLLEEILERLRGTLVGGLASTAEADSIPAAQALLRVLRVRSADELAFLNRINMLKNLRDHDAVESYAEMHASVAKSLQDAGLLWRSARGRLVMNRFLADGVLPLLAASESLGTDTASSPKSSDA